MKKITNPFITSGYLSPHYFCDRKEETKELIGNIANGNNVALISSRRMGKTGLITHCFTKREIADKYYTFFIDIYPTGSIRDFVFTLSREIVERLKPFGQKALEIFLTIVKSLQAGVSFNVTGVPSFNVKLGDIRSVETTLDEIFQYLNQAGKPCLVAIDEFQQINHYREKNVEALLRTHIQQCHNARFIFAGSQRHIMDKIFTSASHPFYQSVSIQHLEAISMQEYTQFALGHFEENGKYISPEMVESVYRQFEGITWYMQKILNTLFSMTPGEGKVTKSMVEEAVEKNVNSYDYSYSETLFRLPARQKELLIAIAKEGNAREITSAEFVKEHSLTSSSSVQSAIRGLLDKDFVTLERGAYHVYDKFLSLWINCNY